MIISRTPSTDRIVGHPVLARSARVTRALGFVLGSTLGVIAALSPALSPALPGCAACFAGSPNVLFISIDDLRPELGVYGSRAITPAIDRLAREGLVFNAAYCQQALCGPSRTSLMTGLRPGRPGICGRDSRDKSKMRSVVDSNRTLPECIRQAGYRTMNVGKSFHTFDTTPSGAWDVQTKPGGGHYQLTANKNRDWKFNQAIRRGGDKARWSLRRGDAVEAADRPDANYQTHRIATRAIGMLDRHLADHADTPFFLSVGFYKPHLPLIAPKKYWDLYNRESFAVPPANPPEGVSKYTLPESWYEVRQFGDIPRKGDLSAEKSRAMIHGYHACVSFVDAQVQRLLDELDTRGLAQDTMVVLWSDHGWKLGDYGDWSKYTPMEIDTRVPMIFRGPGIVAGQTDALVELIDLYPTLVKLCGDGDVPDHVEATSFVPLLSDPGRRWKTGALSYYDRRKPDSEGFSIRGPRFRYTEWRDYNSGEVLDQELYDHRDGPIADRNLAEDPDRAGDVARLAEMLRAGWKSLRADP